MFEMHVVCSKLLFVKPQLKIIKFLFSYEVKLCTLQFEVHAGVWRLETAGDCFAVCSFRRRQSFQFLHPVLPGQGKEAVLGEL